MGRQNRVDPFGVIQGNPARGTMMGNRGILHDAQGRILRSHAHQNWVACVLSFKGRRRAVMSQGSYTELFFHDEATALAAGHRPCGECQRARYRAFRQLWCDVHGPPPDDRPVPQWIDRSLHAARIRNGAKVTFDASLSDLPDGVMVAVEGRPYLRHQGAVWRWSFTGYRPAGGIGNQVQVLTPKPMVDVLRAGYVPSASIEP
ncbi:hypothetical protein [Sagittula sp. SSi028]|uniref:hypothetical protein n=1 Tax=Sagittula sp. SSi028 TaxID=3400636 RepID=UPI003AF92FF5